MEKFKYLGVTIASTNYIREEIKRRINMGNACCYSLEKILSFRLLSKKTKVNTVHIIHYYITSGGLVAQAVRRSPPTTGVPSSRLGPSMWGFVVDETGSG